MTLLAQAVSVIVAVGAEGAPEYAPRFAEWAAAWEKAAGAECRRVSERGPLKEAIDAAREGVEPLWIVLIGHGTFDGQSAKFNLVGPDVSAAELAEWTAPVKRPLAVVNCASASAPFIQAFSGPGRVVITATKSGEEQDATRLGGELARSIGDPASDLDKDGQSSLLEALIAAADRTARWYETEGRLASEHALIDDNGDGIGTRADWFRGVRVTRTAEGAKSPDGRRAAQFVLVRSAAERSLSPEVRAERDRLELAVMELRDAAGSMPEAEYLDKLEKLLLELAGLYER